MESNQFCCANKPASANSGLLRNEAHLQSIKAMTVVCLLGSNEARMQNCFQMFCCSDLCSM